MATQMKADAPRDLKRELKVAFALQQGAVTIEHPGEIAVEFERGNEVCVTVLPACDRWDMEIVFYPSSRTLMLVDHNGIRTVLTQVVSLRQALMGGVEGKGNWTVDFGYAGGKR